MRWLLIVFFLALAVPSVVLIAQAFSQLKWESFRNAQGLAEELTGRVDVELRTAIAAEQARSFGDYSFLVVEGSAATGFVQRSPLSTFPVSSAIPGVLGYFQVDPEGRLTTPLLPEEGVDPGDYGVTPDEAAARRALANEIGNVLAENRLVPRTSTDEGVARASAPSAVPHSRTVATDIAANGGAAADSIAAPPAATSLDETSPRAQLEKVTPTATGLSTAVTSEPRELAAVGAEPVPETPAPAAAPATRAAIAQEAQEAFDRLTADAPTAPARVARRADTQAFGGDAEPTPAAAPVEPSRKNGAAETGPEVTLPARQKRTERSAVPEPSREPATRGTAKREFRVRTFESEIDPLELGFLDTGHLVLFRNVWRDGRRYIQGALIDSGQFVDRAIGRSYRASSLARTTDLAVTYRGERLGFTDAAGTNGYAGSSRELAGRLLHRARLSPPFGDLELVFDVQQLPRAPGTALLAWMSVILAGVLCGGFLLIYRFAIGQIRLTKQQQDFVSAVSHELKTPLTSIRMYGEMLKAGWADEEKKKTYYEYIHGESERLSRLIENVLQLARLTRNTQRIDPKRVTVTQVVDLVKSKVASQIERAGFALSVTDDTPAGTELVVDSDCFAQIFINLVDNALKFSANSQRKDIEIVSRREGNGNILFTVRDFGPGVPKNQMKKIFELFYRPADELTRETVGTGIGLALVHQLATAMGGRVDLRNREPGAEFRLSFPPV